MFTSMTRQELLLELQKAGIYHNIQKDHPLWVTAKEEYIKATKDYETSLSCGGCVNKIRKWLEQ